MARFTDAQRRQLAAKGHALPDGSFPIRHVRDLRNAVHAIGRAAPGKRDKVTRHIVKRARQLGAMQYVPKELAREAEAIELGKWSEWLHPRGHAGKWVDKGGAVPTFPASRGGLGVSQPGIGAGTQTHGGSARTAAATGYSGQLTRQQGHQRRDRLRAAGTEKPVPARATALLERGGIVEEKIPAMEGIYGVKLSPAETRALSSKLNGLTNAKGIPDQKAQKAALLAFFQDKAKTSGGVQRGMTNAAPKLTDFVNPDGTPKASGGMKRVPAKKPGG